MCNCETTFRSDYNTIVCMTCGNEIQTSLSIIQKVSPPDMTPFPSGYNRAKRFLKILDSVLVPTPVAADNLMLAYLFGKTFKTIPDLLAYMKCSKFRDKRYMSIHLFTRLFVESYAKPQCSNVRHSRKSIMREFENIQFAHWRLCNEDQFFNYSWILCVLLEEFDLPQYTQFIKRLRCKNRKKHYTKLLERLRSSYRGSLKSGLSFRDSKTAL